MLEMKKNGKSLIIILIFSIFMMIPVITKPYYKGHDTYFHIANIMSISSKLSWDNLFVYEPLPFIANNFGYGTRFFYPPIPHLTAAYFTKLFQNQVLLGMRVTQWMTFFLSGITFYYLALKVFQNKKIALLLSFFYMTAPYHLSEAFIRDAFSEMFIPIAIPMILLGLVELIDKNYKRFFFFFVLGYILAIFSHLAMSIYFTLMLLGSFFILYRKQIFTKKNIGLLCLASMMILLSTMSFWMPLFEIKLKGNYGVFAPNYMIHENSLKYSTLSFETLFDYKSPHTFSWIRHNLQLFVLILFIASIFIFFKKKLWKNKFYVFSITFTMFSYFLVSKYFPWDYVPTILETLQFPWRITIYIAFASILFAGIFLKNIESKKYFNKVFLILVFFSLFSSYYYTYHSDIVVDPSNIDFHYGLGNEKEYLPVKTLDQIEYYENRSSNIEILKGEGNITIYEENYPNLKFSVEHSKNLSVELPRIYYMGYTLESEDSCFLLTESDYGFIETSIFKDGIYELKYQKTKITKVSSIISITTILIILGFIILKKFKLH